jgi:hypothetical protein
MVLLAHIPHCTRAPGGPEPRQENIGSPLDQVASWPVRTAAVAVTSAVAWWHHTARSTGLRAGIRNQADEICLLLG